MLACLSSGTAAGHGISSLQWRNLGGMAQVSTVQIARGLGECGCTMHMGGGAGGRLYARRGRHEGLGIRNGVDYERAGVRSSAPWCIATTMEACCRDTTTRQKEAKEEEERSERRERGARVEHAREGAREVRRHVVNNLKRKQERVDESQARTPSLAARKPDAVSRFHGSLP